MTVVVIKERGLFVGLSREDIVRNVKGAYRNNRLKIRSRDVRRAIVKIAGSPYAEYISHGGNTTKMLRIRSSHLNQPIDKWRKVFQSFQPDLDRVAA
jgi:hypothetical protein